MKLNEYVKLTKNTLAKLDSVLMNNLHMLLGMSTEIGELQDIFKKHIAYGKEIDWINVKEELGDIMYYVASFCDINHLDLEKIIETNFKKLKSRYPDKFNEFRALNRDFQKERKILKE